MSTKVTIKSSSRELGLAGFHLYDDVLDELSLPDGAEQPVYLELDGVQVELRTLQDGGASVTLTLARELARSLGLLPTK